jgi:outer membrane lipoprotein-sorting protein
MFHRFCCLAILTLLVSGCAAVPMAPAELSA